MVIFHSYISLPEGIFPSWGVLPGAPRRARRRAGDPPAVGGPDPPQRGPGARGAATDGDQGGCGRRLGTHQEWPEFSGMGYGWYMMIWIWSMIWIWTIYDYLWLFDYWYGLLTIIMLKNMEGDMGGNRWKDMDGYGALWNVMWNNME